VLTVVITVNVEGKLKEHIMLIADSNLDMHVKPTDTASHH